MCFWHIHHSVFFGVYAMLVTVGKTVYTIGRGGSFFFTGVPPQGGQGVPDPGGVEHFTASWAATRRAQINGMASNSPCPTHHKATAPSVTCYHVDMRPRDNNPNSPLGVGGLTSFVFSLSTTRPTPARGRGLPLPLPCPLGPGGGAPRPVRASKMAQDGAKRASESPRCPPIWFERAQDGSI